MESLVRRLRLLILSTVLALPLAAALWPAGLAAQGVQLPSYAQQGDAESRANEVGQRITNVIGLIAAIVCIIAMGGIAPIQWGAGNRDAARNFFMGGGIGLLVSGSVWALVALVL